MSAIISDCGRYRYRLERETGFPGPTVAWIMVNPSTADAQVDDATIRKVLGFSRRHPFGRVIVGNLFAYRATDISQLRREPKTAVGPDNDLQLVNIIADADEVVVAWGTIGKLPPELRHHWRAVVSIAKAQGVELMCLGTCADGHPRHPLMVGYGQPFVPWAVPE